MKINTEEYWDRPPPEPSAGLLKWQAKVRAGWKRNRRINQMGYSDSANFFQVYIWEYLNVLQPMLWAAENR